MITRHRSSLLRSICMFAVAVSAFFASDAFHRSAYAQTIGDKIEEIGVSKYVRVVNLRERDVNGLRQIEMELANFNRMPRTIFYRARWMDREGFQAWQDEPWKSIHLAGDQKLRVLLVAPSVRVVDYRIELSAEDNRARRPTL